MTSYRYVVDWIDRLVSWAVIASMAVMTTIVCVQIFFRYVLNDSLSWGWDVPRFTFIWVVLLSIPLGLKLNAHVGIDILVDRFPAAAQRWVRRVNAVFMMILCALAAWYGAQLGIQTADQMMPGIALSVSLFYIALVVSQVHCLFHLLPVLVTGELPAGSLGET
ncbi:MAG: TRAP transporter small permease [Sneathiellaceae bacterium]